MLQRRKLVINLVVILVCGIIAVSAPIIAQHLQKSSHAATQNDNQLVATFGGDQNSFYDRSLIWCIKFHAGDKVLTWSELDTNLIHYDSNHFRPTQDGLGLYCYDMKTVDEYRNFLTAGNTPIVTYRGYTCTLTLPE